RPPTVVSECRQLADGRKLPAVGAEVGLQPPDRHDHRAGYAILLLDAGQHRAVLLHHAPATRHPRRHHAAGELLEALPEHALGMIAGNNPWIVAHAVERDLDRALRDAVGGGLLFDALQPGGEIAAAWRGTRRAGE